jgi:outer membrane lipoprotein SlyB
MNTKDNQPSWVKSKTNGFLVAILLLVCSGCEPDSPYRNTAIGAGGGAALGAGLGAIIGHQTGRAGEGVAIGAGAGAIGGALVGRGMDSQAKRSREIEERQYYQDQEIRRQRREIDEMRRRPAYDRY